MLRPTYMDRFGGPLDTEFIQPTLTDVNRQLQEELDQSLDHIARLDASVVHDCCAGVGGDRLKAGQSGRPKAGRWLPCDAGKY